ncbi:hypothetical protein LAJ19_11520 [Deinococcus taeanensis]|uniref:hypothetical protein n=1 Tax=Deinococcus taeanensis TaxID=2737050 RepID=UPI001CDCE1BB|nr:hypothetical protein [Deinococcus taeanensis]UBV42246.1 hypothetical protein LAJ19_11520 [Deinococcus taeanensis]
MRVGLLETRAARLPGYWAAYLKELGSDPVTPALDDMEALALGRQSLPGEPLTVQLALGRILSMGRVDAVLIPQWPAVTGDAWSEALPDLLSRRISGLPTLISVPDHPEAMEGAAAEVGMRVLQNAGRVRLAIEKVRPLGTDARPAQPALTRASRTSVAVIGPRPLLGEGAVREPLRAALDELGLHPVFSDELPVPEVLRRAERMENAERATDGDRELFGAVSLLSGKGAVKGLIFVSGARDGSTAGAAAKLAARQHKPTLLLSVDGQTDFPDLRPFRDRVTGGAPLEADA